MVAISAKDGRWYHISTDLVHNLGQTISSDAFCASFRLTLADPHVPYLAGNLVNRIVAVRLPDGTGGLVSFSGIIDTARRSLGASESAPALIELNCRGIEAQLVETPIVTPNGVQCVETGLDTILESVARLAGLQEWQTRPSLFQPTETSAFRFAVVGATATAFETLRDVADHFGYSFYYDHRDGSLHWNQGELRSPDQSQVHVLQDDEIRGHFEMRERNPDTRHFDFDAWT